MPDFLTLESAVDPHRDQIHPLQSTSDTPSPPQTFTTSINGSNLELQKEKRADEEILHRETERERERRRRALVSIAGNGEETSREETTD